MKYRLYIDEVGTSDMSVTNNPNNRYLGLTGVIVELDYVKRVLFPQVEAIKSKFFNSHPDEPLILHRKELVNKKPPFEALHDPAVEAEFNQDLLKMLEDLDYVALTVVIDKYEHEQKYQTWRFDPYHYGLTILVERYVMWLRDHELVGDVMAESRGGKEDRRLKDSFTRVFDRGSDYVEAGIINQYLTSRQLKVKPKSNNISGLQLADLIAHPSFKSTAARHNKQELPNNFGGQISKILEDNKYHRSPTGKIEGWGRKWLP